MAGALLLIPIIFVTILWLCLPCGAHTLLRNDQWMARVPVWVEYMMLLLHTIAGGTMDSIDVVKNKERTADDTLTTRGQTFVVLEFNAWTYSSQSLWAALVVMIQDGVRAQIPGGVRMLQSYRMRRKFAGTTRAQALQQLLPIYMLLGGALAAGIATAFGVLDPEDASNAGGDGAEESDVVTSVLVAGPVATVLALIPALKAGWGAIKNYSEDLPKLAQLGRAEASEPDFGGMLGVMPKVKAELDLLGELMQHYDMRMLLYVDDLDRLGTDDKKAVEMLDEIFMLLGENTKMPCITVMAIDTDVVSRTVALKYENQPDADVRALEYLGKIMQLSVGLPEPRQPELKRLVLEVGMPNKAGGRPDREESQDNNKEEKTRVSTYDVTIMESDPLLGFETSERNAFDVATPYLATN
eukprot:SAG31_NODE_9042_length_1344_cov_0.953414_1_plen_411_part_01